MGTKRKKSRKHNFEKMVSYLVEQENNNIEQENIVKKDAKGNNTI